MDTGIKQLSLEESGPTIRRLYTKSSNNNRTIHSQIIMFILKMLIVVNTIKPVLFDFSAESL